MTEERLKFNNQHRREHNISRERSMKRVCTNMEENTKGCWGTVIHGYYMNDNDCWWTILFDDNKKLYWNSKEVYQARCLYDRTTNKIQDPYGNHKAKSASTTAKSASTTVPSQVADESLHNAVAAERPLDGLVFTMNTVKLYPSSSDTQHGDE